MNYETIYYSEYQITVGDYLNDPLQIVYGWNIFDFLSFQSLNGTRNIDNIISLYKADENTDKVKELVNGLPDIVKKQNNVILTKKSVVINQKDYENLILKTGTKIFALYEKINKPALYGTTDILKGINYKAFLSKRQADLMNDQNYTPLTKKNKSKFLGIYLEKFPQLTVWCWSRALNEIIDITPFVSSISTNCGSGEGSFNINLSPVASESINSHKIKNTTKYIDGGSIGYLSKRDLHKNDNLERELSFFHTVISENDLIFIRFETLINEVVSQKYEDNYLRDPKWDKDPYGKIDKFKKEISLNPANYNRYEQQKTNSFTIDSSQLPNNIYDMIGLVDTNVSTTSSNDVTVQISGRDLLKVFIDDGCYFFPMDFAPGGVFANQDEIRYTERLDGKMINLIQPAIKSISYCMSFIFNALSNIKICPNELFQYYTDKNKGYKNEIDDLKKRSVLRKEAEVLRAEAYVLIDKEQSNLQLPIQKAYSGKDIFADVVSFLTALKQTKNIRVLNGSVIGWGSGKYQKLSFVSKKFPINFYPKSFLQSIKLPNTFIDKCYAFIIKQEEVDKFEINKTKKTLEGIWSIMDLYIDQTESDANVGRKRIIDSSFGNENGSLMNVINKLCQKPWVEFFGDTYGDRYSLIIRIPPFTENSFKSLVNLAIDIEPEEVINDNFRFDTSNAFSWYRLQPQWLASSLGDNIISYYIKAVHFPEFAEIWGEKPFEMVNNYYPPVTSGNSNERIESGNAVRQAMYDLKYLIDITAYLPFTRKGQIVINGNRTIKKGTVIRYKPTGEVFYVDGVNNNYSISMGGVDRTTVLSVSRGMVEQNLSYYFKIVNTPINENLFQKDAKDYVSWVRELYSGWQVNKEVFNKFIERKQFTTNGFSEIIDTVSNTDSNYV